jgi:hypothetical protein
MVGGLYDSWILGQVHAATQIHKQTQIHFISYKDNLKINFPKKLCYSFINTDSCINFLSYPMNHFAYIKLKVTFAPK